MAKKSYVVEITKFAGKQAQRLPRAILEAFVVWIDLVEEFGLPRVRQSKGYHDEPLKGHRKGQRSVRLNRSYRVIYEEEDSGDIVVVAVQEVNKHDY